MRWSRRQAVLALVALALMTVASVSFISRNVFGPDCGAEQVDSPRSPLQDAAGVAARADEDLGRTVDAVGAMGPPFGPVIAGAAYYYDQFLRLYGVPDGVLAWTKNNAPVTYLADEDLAPRWSLRPTSKRTAWDASEDRFLLLNLEEKGPVTIAAFDLADGERSWCVEVGAKHQDGQPVATTFLDGGDVVAVLPSDQDVAVIRLARKDGEQDWSRRISTAGRADYLGMLDDRLLVVGGSEEARQADPATTGSSTPTVTALDVATSAVAWTWGDGPSTLHVVGPAAGRLLVTSRSASGTDLVALSATGTEAWRTRLPAGARETTLRSDVLVVRTAAGLEGIDARTGRSLWRRPIPTDRPYVPLGFTLGQMPSTDADHLLLPTVSSLELLDVTDGTSTSYAMPTDGLSSAYFPYQLLVTARHLGVVTNTGAVLAARE